jgi:tRNA(Arg) A34 adenosine deaminase TadA
MCFGALYWARPDKIFYANTKADAASIGFDDQFIYEQLDLAGGQRRIPMVQVGHDDAIRVFEEWMKSGNKALY